MTIFYDENLGITWRRIGNFVVAEGSVLLPSEVWLINGWHLEHLYGNTYVVPEEADHADQA